MIRLLSPPERLLCHALLIGLGVAFSARADEAIEVRRLHESGHTAAALARAEQVLVVKPKEPQMRFFKGVMLADSGRGADAAEVFLQLIQDFPELAEPYNNLAALYAADGEYDKARVTLQQALRADPGYVTALENLGDVHAMLANKAYAQALKLDPGRASTLLPRMALARELFTPKPPAASASK